jgi:Tfp pilus assembly protein PilO
MSKMSREKKSQIILIVMMAVTVCFGLYFGIIQIQGDRINAMNRRRDEMVEKLTKAERALKNKKALETELAARRAELDTIERTMASGDLYSWIIGTMNRRATRFDLNIPTYGRETIGEIGIVPEFPYKAATFLLRGTGTFENLGRFVADLENDRPFFRVQNLDVSPAPAGSGGEYLVQFSFELVAPIRPAQTVIANNENVTAKAP